ncbi:peroxidase [Paraneptunicella aestuarii]|uniref:peroxidase family protein n=1 Tax=Paraneptunicella aestuarii TaxID=2831148 RepID=UPI001E568A9C|nr:heme peroxidase family protein [Paraneptunicella aestuarii]UAA38953.1 peroxidase [Paraneptunicella aestuarii]
MANHYHGLAPFKGLELLQSFNDSEPGRFARLLPELPPLYVNPLTLHKIGEANGVMEDRGLPNLSKTVELGLIFFGQFIDHDITLDDSSSLSSNNVPSKVDNVRTPTLDLDSVYGEGPEASPYLYKDGLYLLTGADYAGNFTDEQWLRLAAKDLPRNPLGTAIIGDPRNDENRVISQMQLGFLRFHNAVVDSLKDRPGAPTGSKLFEDARRVATWHYQWVVLNHFLRTICGDWIVDDILANGRKIYVPEYEADGDVEPFIPIEFATAAYRFGHSMIVEKFRVQQGEDQFPLFGDRYGNGFTPLPNLRAVVDWETLLDSGNGDFERAGQLDTKLASTLLNLPFLPAELPAFERSLATRNLLRAQSFLIPSGEQVANLMIQYGAKEITSEMIEHVSEAAKRLGDLDKGTPLWLYLLQEGQTIGRMNNDGKFERGEGLGPVGARFVAETIIGLMELDDRSFLGTNRNWSPMDSHDKLGPNGVTNLYDLLTFGDN